MIREKIQIGLACAKNCEKYLSFFIETLILNTSLDQLKYLEIILCINDDRVYIDLIDKEIKKAKNQGLIINKVFALEKTGASSGHGFSLDKILSCMNTRYGIFSDCDIAILKKDWLESLFEIMENNNQLIAIGSEYTGQKYKNFPNVVFCIFDVKKVKSLNISFMPGNRITIDNSNKDIFGRSLGENIHLDTGWEFCYKSIKNGFEGEVMKIVSPRIKETHKYLKFMTPDMRGEEYQLRGEPIVTHIGRSYTRSFEEKIVQDWKERVIEWIKSE